MGNYKVTVSNTFEADTYEDAVRQMVEWLVEAAPHTGYRVRLEDGEEVFIDADDVS